MDNFFINILQENGIKHEVRGSEIWYQCPIPGHNNDDENFSASYSVPKNKCNCFVHGGGLTTLLMYLTNGTYSDVKKILVDNKAEIELNKNKHAIDLIIKNQTAPILSNALLKKYKKVIHKPYTFKNFTSKVHLIKKLEIGYDNEGKRVTIPVRDENGDCKMIVKRSVLSNPNLRYLYEPEGCEKSNYIYGINFWRDPEYLIVVEGVKDVIRCIDKGIKNVVAILGSKPSSVQIDILAKSTYKLYVALDDDFAGHKGIKQFLYNSYNFYKGIYIFKHPKITMQEVKNGYRRDMADYTLDEIIDGIKNSKKYEKGMEIYK